MKETLTPYKLIVVGSSNVGKTNILSRYTRDKFDPNTHNTVGIQFSSHVLYIESNPVPLQIWDTAGQEKYRCMTPMFYKLAMIYAEGRRGLWQNSFLNLPHWIKEIKEYASDDVKIILAGNKCDLSQKSVEIQQAEALAKEHNTLYIQVSAFLNLNIDAAFQHLVLQIYKSHPNPSDTTPRKTPLKPIQIQQSQKAKKKRQCC